MIKANELRIGNWVSDSIGLETRLTVLKIERDVITCGDDDFSYPYLIESLQSVPLQSWILAKVGFVKDYCGGDTDETFVWRLDLPEGEFVLSSDFVLCSTDTLCRVNSAHQLQNLYFALTGTELNIQL